MSLIYWVRNNKTVTELILPKYGKLFPDKETRNKAINALLIYYCSTVKKKKSAKFFKENKGI